MASTNKTTHYDLPQWIGTDKPTFLGDLNGAFSTIDTQLYTAVTNADNANNNATSAAGAVSNMQNDVNGLKTWQTTASSAISGLQNSVRTLTPVISSGSNLVTGIGTFLSSFSPTISANNITERLITLGSLKLLNIYGILTISYTGTPASSAVTDNVKLIQLENIYSKYNIPTNRIFYEFGTISYRTSESYPNIPLSLHSDNSKAFLTTSNWDSGNLVSNSNLSIIMQLLLCLN